MNTNEQHVHNNGVAPIPMATKDGIEYLIEPMSMTICAMNEDYQLWSTIDYATSSECTIPMLKEAARIASGGLQVLEANGLNIDMVLKNLVRLHDQEELDKFMEEVNRMVEQGDYMSLFPDVHLISTRLGFTVAVKQTEDSE